MDPFLDALLKMIERFGLPLVMLVLFIWLYLRKEKEVAELHKAVLAQNDQLAKINAENGKAWITNAEALIGLREFLKANLGKASAGGS